MLLFLTICSCDAQWCVSNAADHGGVYSYIVEKYLDPNYTPNENDWTAMEDCFQAGILKCSDVPGQNCAVHPDWYAAPSAVKQTD